MTDSISSVRGRIIYNSRGQPTIEVEVAAGMHIGRAAAPSGASVGKHEAVSFPDGGPRRALDILADNSSRFVGADPADHAHIHSILRDIDQTPDYHIMGGALAYAV